MRRTERELRLQLNEAETLADVWKTRAWQLKEALEVTIGIAERASRSLGAGEAAMQKLRECREILGKEEFGERKLAE